MTNEAERLRRARLGSALRENLRRRKAQVRARNEVEPTQQIAEAPPEPNIPIRDTQPNDSEPGG
jgi:hypothetical protein